MTQIRDVRDVNDIVVSGATVYDGTGADSFAADIAINDGKIVGVGDHAGPGMLSLDGAGLCVAPGFIDVHTHDDYAVAVDPDMGFKVLGGVTTSIVGNCGEGPVPFEAGRHILDGQYPDADLPPWPDYGSYIDWVGQHPASLNVVALVGHGTIRAGVLDHSTGAASPRQRTAIREQIGAALDAGASGASFGLFYEPGRSAPRDELLDVAREVAERDLVLAVHIRDEGAGLIGAIDEVLGLAGDSGARLQISHHKAAGPDNHGLVRESLRRIEAARQGGLEVNCDQYPYTASSTHLGDVLADPGGVGGFRPADIEVCLTTDQSLCGVSLERLGETWAMTPFDAARALVDTDPTTTVVLHSMSEDDVISVLSDPHTMIGSDGLPNVYGISHPRLYGTFARVIGRYARDAGVISVQEAIHRMTGLAARTFGLHGRGHLTVGSVADLVVFSLPSIMDRPGIGLQGGPPSGIRHVIVNGELVVQDGQPTGARPGSMVRRGDCSTEPRT